MNSYLILENGAVFKGQSFGYDGEALGELVFTTEMAGYLETLGDSNYFGQIVLQTFPLIGNYGVIPSDIGGKPGLRALIVRQWCQEPSNFRSEGELDTFLRLNKIPGLCGIDTRALTHILRENGVMNAMISKTQELTDEQWAALRGYKVTDAVAKSMSDSDGESSSAMLFLGGKEQPKHDIAVWDFGASQGFIREISKSGCAKMIHLRRTADKLLATNPDGIILSDGPGDPAENTAIIEEIKKLCEAKIPMLGVGLGHQMLALARGAKTEKLHFGHRGANQPVRDVKSGRAFVTTQNHGYTVARDSLPETAEMIYQNCNDDTCEGIEYSDIPAFSIEFRPGVDTGVFEKFIALMERGDGHAAE